jgi:DNA-binding NarL/FixJ family response regulator
MRDCAAWLVDAYFPVAARIGGLPEPLVEWLAREAAQSMVGAASAPLVVLGHGADLVVRLVRQRHAEGSGLLDLLGERPHTLGLTPRQSEVLVLVPEWLRSAEVARRLGVSVRMVGKHLEHWYRTLGMASRTAAVRVLRGPGPDRASW